MPTATSTSAEINPAAEALFPYLAQLVDRESGAPGAAISYISNDRACVIRQSDAVIQTHVVITPTAAQEQISGKRMQGALVDVGFDCGFAAISYTATAAACSGAVATAGAAAPLCVVGLSGSVASSWKCGTSIGNLYRAANDPNFDRRMETDPEWYRNLNTAIDWLDNISGTISLMGAGKQMTKLVATGRRHVGKVATYTRKQSVAAYRELADAMGEALSVQGTKRWINQQGHNLRFTMRPVYAAIGKTLADAGLTAAGLADDPLKDAIKQGLERVTAPTAPPPYCMHVLQQAQP